VAAPHRSNGVDAVIDGARAHMPLLREIAGTSGARIYSTLLSLATLTLTARWLGPQGRGIVVVITTWAALVAGIAHLSIGQVLVHRAANEPGNDWIGSALGAVATVTAIATALGWVAVASLYAILGNRLFDGIPGAAIALGLTALPFLIWEQYGSALLSIVGQLNTYNLAQIVGRSIAFLLVIVTIRLLGWGIYGFLLAFVAGQVIVAGAGVTALARHCDQHVRAGLSAVGALVRDGLKLHLNAIGVLLFSGVDILMLQYFRGPAETAIFQLPMQLFLALLLVPQAAQLSLQSRVSSRGRAQFWGEHRLVLALIIGGMSLVAAALWLLAPWLVTLIGGEEFAASVPVFRILLLGVPWACFNTLMAIQWIIRGYFYQASLITLATGLTNCLLNLILIPSLGPVGAAWAALIGMCAVPFLANGWLAALAQREFAASGGQHESA
jgi:O-antigen/teichoic acid export membrane protein